MRARARAGALVMLGTFVMLASCGGDRHVAPAAVTGAGAERRPLVVVDPRTTYQTMVGWEAASESGHETGAFARYRDTLFALAVNDLGLNRIRLEVRAGAENPHDYWADYASGRLAYGAWRCPRYAVVNDDADPNTINPAGFTFSELDAKVERIVLPMKRLLEARGERLFVNLQYVAFGVGGCKGMQIGHPDPAEYAEFVLAASLHLREKYGLVPDAWEADLEPDNGTPFPDGASLGRAIVAAGARLEAAGFHPEFIAPSTKSMRAASAYFDGVLSVPGALKYVKELSYHRYGGVSRGNLAALVRRAEAHGLRTAMLEHMGADYDELHQDLTEGRNSAWEQFTLAYPTKDNGAQYYVVDTSGGGAPRVIEGRRTTYFKQYFRHVRRGARRIGASSESRRVDPLAFVNADGRTVVVMKADGGADVYVKGLPAARYGVSYTTERERGVEAGEVTLRAGELLHAGIPAEGVFTVYAK